MRIYETGHDDHVRCVNHLRAPRFQVWTYRSDFGAFDQYIALHEVADLFIEAENNAILQQSSFVCHLSLLLFEMRINPSFRCAWRHLVKTLQKQTVSNL